MCPSLEACPRLGCLPRGKEGREEGTAIVSGRRDVWATPVGDSRGGGEPCEQVCEVDGIQHREGRKLLLGDGQNAGTEGK